MEFLLITILVPAIIFAFPDKDIDNPFKNANKWIDIINNDPHSTWKAGQNFDPNLPSSYINKLLGMRERKNGRPLPVGKPITDIDDNNIPSKFDARKKWKNCKSLQQIRDQGDCGSCWAVGAASAYTDRLCISTKGRFNGHLSTEELLSCCTECGYGCSGGYPEDAWEYFVSNGIVTGGDYNSTEGCQPYSLQPCEHHVEGGSRPQCSSLDPVVTPECSQKCTNKQYTVSFDKDHKKTKTAYTVSSSETAIQKEILKYGPVEAGFTVYEDFLSYKSGVYQHSPSSARKGGHAVKLIGWGVEKGVKYWLVQNSWNYDWGDKGLFKILRGTDECAFESRIIAGHV